MHIMKILSEFVKARRKEAGLTQEDFADRAGVALTLFTSLASSTSPGVARLRTSKTLL